MLLLVLTGCEGALLASGPRPAGAMSRAFINGAELKILYRYDPVAAAELNLFVDLTAVSGDAGEVAIELEPDGFEVVGTPSSFALEVSPGETGTRQAKLRVLGTKTPTVTIVTTRAQGTVEIARDTLRFVVEEGMLRECQPDDAVCGDEGR
jgi:hypothetical protein